MPVQPTYPGVYIEEIPSGVHTIIGVATSITAFLGRTERGPANEATTLTSFGDYERTFGPLNPSYPVSYTIRDFFDNGGGMAIVVRLFKDPAQDAAIQVAAAGANSTKTKPDEVAKDAGDKAKTYADDANAPQSAKDAAAAVAKVATDKAAEQGASIDAVVAAAQAKAASTPDV